MTLLDEIARAIDPEAFERGWEDKIGFAHDEARAALSVILRKLEEDGDLRRVAARAALLSFRESRMSEAEQVLRAIAAHLREEPQTVTPHRNSA
jgi:hypothetical protein